MTRKKRALFAIATIGLFMMASSAARASLVLNGDFEQTTSGFGIGAKNSFPNAQVTNWSGGAGLTFLDAPGTADNGSYLNVYGPFPNQSPTGGNFVEGDADPGFSGVIYQTINLLTPGQLYAVSFYQAAGEQSGFGGATSDAWQVGLGTSLSDSEAKSLRSSAMSIPANGVVPWQMQTLDFTATSSSEVLSFLAIGPAGGPPIAFLDGVAVNAVFSTPEPSSLLLLGAGLLGLGVARVRQRARSTVA